MSDRTLRNAWSPNGIEHVQGPRVSTNRPLVTLYWDGQRVVLGAPRGNLSVIRFRHAGRHSVVPYTRPTFRFNESSFTETTEIRIVSKVTRKPLIYIVPGTIDLCVSINVVRNIDLDDRLACVQFRRTLINVHTVTRDDWRYSHVAYVIRSDQIGPEKSSIARDVRRELPKSVTCTRFVVVIVFTSARAVIYRGKYAKFYRTVRVFTFTFFVSRQRFVRCDLKNN